MLEQDYKQQCTCGDYTPYNPSGVVAALQPFGSCVNCWHTPLARYPEDYLTDSDIVLISDTLSNIHASMAVPKDLQGKDPSSNT